MRHLAWRLKRHSVSRVDTFVVIVVVSYQKLFFLHKRLFYNHKTKSWSKRKIHQSDHGHDMHIFTLSSSETDDMESSDIDDGMALAVQNEFTGGGY